jgi:hypothetical protein
MLVVNASDTSSQVQFSAPPLCHQRLNAWGRGSGTETGAEGQFSDHLGPYEVRIYSSQPDRLKDVPGGTW